MKQSPINSYSLKWSCGLHGALLMCALMVPLLPQFRPREMPIVTEFTVVVDENLAESVPVEPAPVQPPPKPETIPDPDKPAPLPDPKETIPIEPKPEKKPEPVKKPEPEKKPEPVKKPEPKTFEKGKRVTLPPDKTKEDFTKLKPVTQRALTPAEIRKLLNDGAKVSTHNSVPPNEVSRCLSIIQQTLTDAWDQPGASAGSIPAILTIRLDSTGRIIEYRIRQSSGNAAYDQTVLKAAANCPPIRGLTIGFLKQYETIPVEFKLQ